MQAAKVYWGEEKRKSTDVAEIVYGKDYLKRIHKDLKAQLGEKLDPIVIEKYDEIIRLMSLGQAGDKVLEEIDLMRKFIGKEKPAATKAAKRWQDRIENATREFYPTTCKITVDGETFEVPKILLNRTTYTDDIIRWWIGNCTNEIFGLSTQIIDVLKTKYAKDGTLLPNNEVCRILNKTRTGLDFNLDKVSGELLRRRLASHSPIVKFDNSAEDILNTQPQKLPELVPVLVK